MGKVMLQVGEICIKIIMELITNMTSPKFFIMIQNMVIGHRAPTIDILIEVSVLSLCVKNKGYFFLVATLSELILENCRRFPKTVF